MSLIKRALSSLACRPPSRRAVRKLLGVLSVSAPCVAAAPSAHAAVPGDRVDFTGYGRMGMAWSRYGQEIQGKTMNLTPTGIGGRFEEGDYVEPTLTLHLVKPEKDDADGLAVDAGLTTSMFARTGSFLALLANGRSDTLGFQLLQAYVEARNVFTPGLTFWVGGRQYRGTDVHIADYFYFNDLTGQGGGVKYKGIDVAILAQTAGPNTYPGFTFDVDGDDVPDVSRTRTLLAAQYTHNFGNSGHALIGLTELHILPAVSLGRRSGELAGGDHGSVVGAKLHLDLGRGQFNDVSFRYGNRIANGALGGRKTWQTVGPAGADGTYENAYGIEAVEHFLLNFGTLLTLNGYGILHYNKASDEGEGGFIRDVAGAPIAPDHAFDFGVGARTILYAHKQFHLVNELSFQGRKDGDNDMGTAVKASIVPTIVPTGELTAWARPHLRAIYTAGFYNEAAVSQSMSPYLVATGSSSRVAHYIGARGEWWY